MRRVSGGRGVALTATALAGALTAAAPAAAQRFEGRVLDDEDGRPVATALVRLLDESLEPLAVTVADELGAYRISAPGPGRYHLAAERIGFDPFTSHLLEVGDPERTYTVDIGLRAVPLPISGFVVTAERFREIERGVQLEIGVSTKSLRFAPIMRPEIEEHVARAHDVEDVVRWSNQASIVVKQTTDGPCFQWRGRHCIDVYLNGFRVNPGIVPILPLEMVETMVIVTPGETMVYGSGAILLYTKGWIG